MKKNLTIPAEDSMVEAIDRIAEKAGMTRTAYLRAIIQYALAEGLEPVIQEIITEAAQLQQNALKRLLS